MNEFDTQQTSNCHENSEQQTTNGQGESYVNRSYCLFDMLAGNQMSAQTNRLWHKVFQQHPELNQTIIALPSIEN